LVVILFAITFGVITHSFSPYSIFFSKLALLAVLLQGLLLSLMMMGVPTRNLEKHISREQIITKKIAEATLSFEELKPEEAYNQIKEAMAMGPDRIQISQIADLAWQNEYRDFAEQCYKNVLRKAYTGRDMVQLLTCVQGMLFRHIKVPDNFFLKAIHQAIDTNQIQETEKLLPHLKERTELDRAVLLEIYERLTKLVLSKKAPDKFLLNKLRNWLTENHPDTDALTAIHAFFEKQSGVNSALEGFGHLTQVHRSVDVEMLKVTTTNVYLQVSGKEQRIPWTATIGFFGCHVAEAPKGFRGCILIKFKRKNFVCIFTTPRILLREENNKPMSFERLWALLKSQVPEDIPFLEMRDFPEITSEAEIVKITEEFINTHEGIEANL